ncbi:hypothetical protein M5689_020740 [Euphorbia peplus]|nr:hypothetical protein M5689_020740 [Euphorbia peplus]
MAPGLRSRTNLRPTDVRATTNVTPQSQPTLHVPAQSNLSSSRVTTRSVDTLTSEANSDTSSQNTATNPTITTPTDTESAVEKKRGRGKAIGFEVKKRLKEGKKIDGVTIDKDTNFPIGPAEKIFKMEVGIITRMLAPLRVFYWKHMSDDHKQPLFARLESEFEIAFDDPHAKEVIDSAMANRFKQYKHSCHNHYKKYTPEDAKKNPPEDVTQDDWVHLCDHFESDGFKKQSGANKLNRAKSQVPNRTGSKSFAQRISEMQASQVDLNEPAELKLYFDMHHNKDGTWFNLECQENYDKMIAEFQRSKEEEEVPLSGQQIVEKIMKPKSRKRAARVYRESFQSEKQARELLEEKLQTQVEKVKSQEETIANLQASHAELKALFMSAIDRNRGQTSLSPHFED